ncbi:hypothetical protein AB0J72_52230 [Dactylosporangium sp. NPDC049742]|uniref:hypothetical protein n=1 Tax=Dactylosporangium sp. NPDC049742 TaxID=3154737 RepID=UPI00344603A6
MRAWYAAVAVMVVAALAPAQPAGAYVARTAVGARAATVTAGKLLTVAGATATNINSATPVTVTVSNPNPFRRWAHIVTAVFATSSKNGCSAADYQINGSPRTVGRAVPANGTTTVSGVTVTAAPGCKGTTVTLTYTVS